MKFINKIQKFMYGRYRSDELYMFLFKIYLVLFIVNLFLKLEVLTYIELVLVFIMLYRFFSKNLYKRRCENIVFLNIRKRVLKPFDAIIRNVKDKRYVYKRCFKCKTILKLPLPSKRGIKKAKCPHCGNRVRLFTLKKDKIIR